MEDWMITCIMLVLGVGGPVGGGLVTKYFDTKWGITAARKEIASLRQFVEDDNNIIKKDVKGIVRCMCKVNPEFKLEWQEYRAKVWERENGIKPKHKKKPIEVENDEEV